MYEIECILIYLDILVTWLDIGSVGCTIASSGDKALTGYLVICLEIYSSVLY
jgi:hypothetical protein